MKNKEDEKTVRIDQIQKVIATINQRTLELYLKSWRFAPFERKIKYSNFYRYEYLYCKDFFNNLYTYLVMKRKI